VKAEKMQQKMLFEAVRTPGYDLFGLSSPITLRFIQALPGAEQCSSYQVKVFKIPFFTLQKSGFLAI
jgi:hypothetical protein